MFKVITFLAIVGLCSAINIDDLVSKMSIEEKCGQMTQITVEVVQLNDENIISQNGGNPLNETKLADIIDKLKIGSILNTPFGSARSAEEWQITQKSVQDAVKKSKNKNKIPIIYGIDSIHGANYIREATLMPQPLAMASSFNPEIARQVGEITAMETKAVGIPWNFNPVLDQGRNPLWPRIWETYGEDQYLATLMGLSYISGSEGGNPKNKTKVVTCLKHYIGYSTPRNGRDRSTAWIPEIVLREFFLPPFAAAVKAGAMTVMINSGDVNGIPGHANKQYITDILKGELGFEGFTVSDWEDIKRLGFRDHVAQNISETVRISVMAGLDMSMVPGQGNVQSLAPGDNDVADFHQSCVDLANNDAAFMNRVNDANKRILKVKDLAGLFDDASNSISPDTALLKNVDAESSHAFNLEAAREAVILAKNDDNILPIKKNTKKLLVTGPTGNLLKILNGGWSYSWQGDNEWFYENYGRKDRKTVYKKLKEMNLPQIVDFNQGAEFDGHDAKIIENDLNTIRNSDADYIVLCIGENTYTEGFGSIVDLNLDSAQRQLAEVVLGLNKPVIVVYLGGRPRIITDIVDNSNVKAVLVSFLPGNRGGEAIGDIIFGDANPSAKFPITYPRHINAFTNYDVSPIEDWYKNELFAFGSGKSFTSFSYSDLTLSSYSLEYNQNLDVSVTVKNTGSRDGKEVVILYLNDNFASVSRPTKQVKRFEKVLLKAGESKKVTFTLEYSDYTFIDQDMKRVAEVGNFTVFIENLKDSFRLNSVQTEAKSSASTVFVSMNLALMTLIISIFN